MNKKDRAFRVVAFSLVLIGLVFSAAPLLPAAPPSGAAARPTGRSQTSRNPFVVIPADSPALAQFKTAVVEVGTVPGVEVTAPGKIEFDVHKVARLTLPVAGRIDQVFVELGDRVGKGSPLLTIDSPDADAALAEYRQSLGNVTLARSTLVKAQADLARIQDLYAHMAVAKKELLAAEYAEEQARTALEQAETSALHLLKKLRIMGLDEKLGEQKVFFRAPLAGKIMEMAIVPGEYRNDISAPVFTIANLDSVWVTSEIPEDQIRHVSVGEKVEVELVAFPGETYHARVTRIADQLNPQTRTVKVRAELPNPGGKLLPEMFGTIRHSHPPQTLPSVPPEAIVTCQGKKCVFVERKTGTFELVPVVTAPAANGRVPVRQGLRGGEKIVVEGVMQLVGMGGR